MKAIYITIYKFRFIVLETDEDFSNSYYYGRFFKVAKNFSSRVV